MRPIVADSGPLISFARIDRLDLIEKICGQIHIPPSVAEELAPRGERRRGASALRAAHWIMIQDLEDPGSLEMVSPGLGVGERAAIALAHERNLELLIDDAAGRREATRLKIVVLGSVGLLLEAKVQRVILQVRPLLNALLKEGFRLSPALYREILQRAGESKKRPRV
jgi:predicted nucleic acid-binding protein